MGVGYRAWQFWQQLSAPPFSADAWRDVRSALSPAEQRLFERFAAVDRWHSWRVMWALREAGHAHPDLMAAALLHDVGKTAMPLTAWQRVLIVLGSRIMPRRAAAWGEGEAVAWKRPFVVKAQHPEWGARMAAAAGSRPLTVWLIRHHQDALSTVETEEARLLQQLQWADDRN